MHKITEGKAVIIAPKTEKISKDMPIFYNPVMKHNRDISILLLKSINKKDMQIALPLSATGIRGIRFLLELNKSTIKEIHLNDYDRYFKKIINNNLKLNNLKKGNKIKIHNTEANIFLLRSSGFDYIDIDPFGTPNKFLDSAVKRISREGILAVTATDTSALAGTYPKACLRKYWANPLRNELMHETGLRILIRKIQLIGAQYEKALTPIFSYSKDHYMRVFLKCEKSKKEVNHILKQHDFYEYAGPLWNGPLFDKSLTNNIYKNAKNDFSEDKELIKFLRIIKDESHINTIGFYDIHAIVKRNKIKTIPKKLELINKIKNLGSKASETHFNNNGIRSDCTLTNLVKLLK